MTHMGGYMTSGSYFTYQGVRYGKYTLVNFSDEFKKRINEHVKPGTFSNMASYPKRMRLATAFNSVKEENGRLVWAFGEPMVSDWIVDFEPDRDIARIVTPVYYLTPKEMVKHRLKNGSWFLYVWKQTLVYVLCLLISPLFKQWYIIWTTGLYLYLRLCYIELSRGEIHEIPQ